MGMEDLHPRDGAGWLDRIAWSSMNRPLLSGWILSVLTLLVCAGCGGAASNPDVPERTYEGLKGQQVGVLVWADWKTRTDFNQIQLDTTRLLQSKLEMMGKPTSAKDAKEAEKMPLAGTTFLHPGTVARYQREHPEVWAMPIQDVAPKLGVPRVIFVEIVHFQAQAPEAIMLLNGKAKVNLRVLDVANGKATVAFEELDITANYPPNMKEGVPVSDKYTLRSVYEGTIDELTTKLALRFVPKKD